MHSFFKSKLTVANISFLENLATKLNVPVDWLCAVINFETAGSFLTTKTNPNSGAVGLIQFMPDYGKSYKTIEGKQYTLDAIRLMNFQSQCNLIYSYFQPYIKKVTSFTDLYLAVFFPMAIGQKDDYVLKTNTLSALTVANQNKIFDINNSGKITKKEVETYFTNYYTKLGLVDLSDSLKKKEVTTLPSKFKTFYIKNKTYILVVCAVFITSIALYFSKKR